MRFNSWWSTYRTAIPCSPVAELAGGRMVPVEGVRFQLKPAFIGVKIAQMNHRRLRGKSPPRKDGSNGQRAVEDDLRGQGARFVDHALIPLCQRNPRIPL